MLKKIRTTIEEPVLKLCRALFRIAYMNFVYDFEASVRFEASLLILKPETLKRFLAIKAAFETSYQLPLPIPDISLGDHHIGLIWFCKRRDLSLTIDLFDNGVIGWIYQDKPKRIVRKGTKSDHVLEWAFFESLGDFL